MNDHTHSQGKPDWAALATEIKSWAQELGFADCGIARLDLKDQHAALERWLSNHYHGDMDYMARNREMRTQPSLLHPGSLTAIVVRMDYLPPQAGFADTLSQPHLAYISRYAGGRDYHKLMRNRLKQLGNRLRERVRDYDGRPFVDSAPILERPLAREAGLGWVGKHSLLLERSAGSWFFIGELLTNLPLPVDPPYQGECGNCSACLTLCPTQAIVAPYVVDARRCISYLTIESDGAIPEALRPQLGNRIYGCDDCQLACPHNRTAPLTAEGDFHTRPQLHQVPLLTLWQWSEAQFLAATEGSPIRRIGFRRWQRNLAVALGNAAASAELLKALEQGVGRVDPMVDEHILWAIERQRSGLGQLSKQQQRLVRVVQKGLPRDA
ncbi:tRNA epoxyqueuosine(34) reductase QueG [Ferrimonas sediminicola]|uniref:Epoxyqueuosine reductase n=1 Tax=Ferrimonas sediminicola TaxID=2569538 RepID=A0A4U1BF50_9GAMM|nr:tRNA epoxyqueuosine(34) reductase QueG [Ferrimonas sediminicola]TKB49508.1 tRNA epoxyqueuosine(34) reductase QueG [Ferrimonas sediminicola]